MRTALALVSLSLLSGGFVGIRADPGKRARPEFGCRLRQPVALVLADNGKRLFTANRISGTVSAIDTESLKTIAEVRVGRKLADLAATADDNELLAVDEDAGELIFLRRCQADLEPVRRIPVGPGPVSVQVSPNGTRATVALLWAGRVVVVALRPEAKVVRTIDLSFAPHRQLLLNDRQVLVADAFGGKLALVSVDKGQVESVRELPAHNIRGLALSADGKRLLLTQQTLNPRARADFDDIHWGNLLTNNLRSLSLAEVQNPTADLLRGSDLVHFGDAGHGTGDPAGVAVAGDTFVVALAGVGEIAVRRDRRPEPVYIAVGRRPTAVVLSPDGRRAYVADTFGDAVAVVDLDKLRRIADVSLGPRPELKPAERGEMLFHDSRLSHDGWMSCHSCHSDGHSNGRLADTLADGSFATPKRVLSLLGAGDTGPWAWNGAMRDLETQVRRSVESTMQGRKPSEQQVNDLVAYVKSLSPPPARPRLRGKLDDAALHRGEAVFAKQSCGNCHTTPLYTSAKTYDVSVADESGQRKFNPPSLRGLSQGGPYLHDGRAATLEEVFSRHRHQLKDMLAKRELDDLLTFLNSL